MSGSLPSGGVLEGADRAGPGEQTWIVLEYCDKGCLQVGEGPSSNLPTHAPIPLSHRPSLIMYTHPHHTHAHHTPAPLTTHHSNTHSHAHTHTHASRPPPQDAVDRGWLRDTPSFVQGGPNILAALTTAHEVRFCLCRGVHPLRLSIYPWCRPRAASFTAAV